MQRVTIDTDDGRIVIDNVSKVDIDMAFDMFENKIVIYSENGKRTLKQYEIIHILIEDM